MGNPEDWKSLRVETVRRMLPAPAGAAMAMTAIVMLPTAIITAVVAPDGVGRNRYHPAARRRRAHHDRRRTDGSRRNQNYRGRAGGRNHHNGRLEKHGQAEGNAHRHTRPRGESHGDQCDCCDCDQCFNFHTPDSTAATRGSSSGGNGGMSSFMSRLETRRREMNNEVGETSVARIGAGSYGRIVQAELDAAADKKGFASERSLAVLEARSLTGFHEPHDLPGAPGCALQLGPCRRLQNHGYLLRAEMGGGSLTYTNTRKQLQSGGV